MKTLRLPRKSAEELRTAASRRFPEEACGVLIGRGHEVEEILETANAARERRTRYEISPRDLFAVHKRCRAEGREVVGYWHSHPNGSAEPSREDGRGAFPGVSFVIVPVAVSGAEAPRVGRPRSWRWSGGGWQEERVEVGPSETRNPESG